MSYGSNQLRYNPARPRVGDSHIVCWRSTYNPGGPTTGALFDMPRVQALQNRWIARLAELKQAGCERLQSDTNYRNCLFCVPDSLNFGHEPFYTRCKLRTCPFCYASALRQDFLVLQRAVESLTDDDPTLYLHAFSLVTEASRPDMAEASVGELRDSARRAFERNVEVIRQPLRRRELAHDVLGAAYRMVFYGDDFANRWLCRHTYLGLSHSRESCATERPYAELRVHHFTGLGNLAGVFGRLNAYPSEWISGSVELQAALIDGLHNRRASALYGILRQTRRIAGDGEGGAETDEAAA